MKIYKNSKFNILFTCLFIGVNLIVPINFIFAQSYTVITDIQSEKVENDVYKITWKTNTNSGGKVVYGEDKDNLSSFIIDSNRPSKFHDISIGNLEEETIYYYKVQAYNNYGVVNSFIYSFETEKFNDGISPDISNLETPYVTGTAAFVIWETDEDSSSWVDFGVNGNYTNRAGGRSLTRDHQIILRNLSKNTKYYIRAYSFDEDNNRSSYISKNFTTTSGNAHAEDLEISNLRPSGQEDPNIFGNAILVQFKTNHYAKGSVRIGNQTKNLNYGSSHKVVFSGLTPGKDYSLYIKMKDIFGKVDKTENIIITTKKVSSVFNNTTSSGPVFYASYDNGIEPEISGGSNSFFEIKDIDFKAGKFGQAIELKNDKQIIYQGAGNFDINQGTIAFWFNPKWNSNDDKGHVLFNLSPGYSKVSEKYFFIGKLTAEDQGVKNNLVFALEDSSDNDYWSYINSSFSANNWYFVVATWNYGGDYKLYLNGSDNNLKYNKNKKLGKAPKLGDDFNLGGENNYFNSTSDYLIDELMIFNRALSNSEVTQLFNGNLDLGNSSVDEPEETVINIEEKVIVKGVDFSLYTPASRLLKTLDSPDIYAVVNNQRHYISSPASFNEYGYNWGEIETVSRDELNKYSRARLIKSAEDNNIYFLYQRPENQWLKINMPSPTVFVSYPDNFWGNVITVTQLDVDSYPDVRLIKTKDSSDIYFIESGIKHYASEEVFISKKFSIIEIAEVNQTHLDSFQLGNPLN